MRRILIMKRGLWMILLVALAIGFGKAGVFADKPAALEPGQSHPRLPRLAGRRRPEEKRISGLAPRPPRRRGPAPHRHQRRDLRLRLVPRRQASCPRRQAPQPGRRAGTERALEGEETA